LVAAGANPDIVDNNGQTPIFYAIRFNKFEMVEYLIQRGVNIKIEDKRGSTPAHWAKKHSKT
jgi:ankyrin repeat protein